MAEETLTRSNGDFNRAAIKRQALLVSEKTRRGKFTRVSEEFFNTIEAEVESQFRRMRAELGAVSAPLGTVNPPEGEKFLTGAGERKLVDNFNIWMAREIQRRVNATRTGCTL